jgi:hypothetical protein
VALRTLGINSGHPWVRQLASRPWRDGQDVLRLSLRHLPEVFVITPRGSLLAPNAIELRMSPRDFASLTEVMDIDLINSSASEVYEEEVAGHGAHFAGPDRAEVSVVSDPAVPDGRYRLQQSRVQQRWAQDDQFRQAQPPRGQGRPPPELPQQTRLPGGQVGPGRLPEGRPENGPHLVRHVPGSPFPFAHDGRTTAARAATIAPAPPAPPAAVPGPAPMAAPATAAPVAPAPPVATAITGLPTLAESSRRAIPPLRLVSGQSVAQTWTSGARAGRGAVELVLPDVPTVSREHARFTFADGHWWVANLGMNGLTLNGVPLVGEQPVADGDSIRWGTSGNAMVSRVEIG